MQAPTEQPLGVPRPLEPEQVAPEQPTKQESELELELEKQGALAGSAGQGQEADGEAEQQQAASAAAAALAALGGESAPAPICAHCGALCNSVRSYFHPDTRARLCSGCRYFLGRNGVLPDVVHRQRILAGEEEEPSAAACSDGAGSAAEGAEEGGEEVEEGQARKGRRADAPWLRHCLACGGDSHRGTSWHRHPVTKAEWLCEPCYNRVRSRLKRERRQAAIYVPAGLLPQVAQGEREETETEGAEDAPAFDAGRQRDRAGEEGEGAGLLGRLYGGFDALRPAAVPPPTPAAAASAAAADATPDTRHSKRQRLAGSPLPGEQEQQVQAPLGNGHLAGLAGVAAPEGATAAAAAAAGGPLPLQADWLLLYQRLDGLLTRSGVDPVQAQRYKLTLLNTLNTTEELARSHFYEVQKEAEAGRPELVRSWVSAALAGK